MLAHIKRRRSWARGSPESCRRRALVVAGVWVGVELALRLANEPAVALVLLYGMLRVQRTHARDQKVTGASPSMSPCGGGYDKQGGDGYDGQIEEGLGEK